MPILKTLILGSTIEIDYQYEDKEKLITLIDSFKKRLVEFEKLKGKFSDNKVIFLAALKAEDKINEILKELEIKEQIQNQSDNYKNQNEIQIKELVDLKDQITFLKKSNQKLKEQNEYFEQEIHNVNLTILSLIKNIEDNINEKN